MSFLIMIFLLPLYFQRPDLWPTEGLGMKDWMTAGDMAKLRFMYECNGRE